MDLFVWFWNHQTLVWTVLGGSVLTCIVGLLAVRFLAIYMPADYFAETDGEYHRWRSRHPAVRWTLVVLKNVAGWSLVIAGIIMLFAPGPGILSILFGLSLIDFPGKRALELRLISNRVVLDQINSLRAKANRPPLKVSARC